jgi:hypothetical protein
MNAGWALQKAIYNTLTSDGALTDLLGGQRIYDEVPRGAEFPYVTLGQSTVRDWSTATDDGEEHVLTLHVWSEANGHREATEIIGALRGALHDRELGVSGHRLVNLRQEFAEARREPDGEAYHALVRYRAVTEPL